MAAHVHAALMAEYAKDALETDKPWERWEFQWSGSSEWNEASAELAFSPKLNYRRKPTALCQVEGRDVFPGDKLWHRTAKLWLTAGGANPLAGHIRCVDYGGADISHLSWTAPPQMKTVYQWAMRQGDRWLSSSVMVADKAEMIANFPNFTDFRRLDYTALEVPA